MPLDRGHRVVDQLADGRLLGVGLQMRPARLLGHPEDVLGQVLVRVFGGGGVFGQQRRALRLEGVGDVLEEDQAEDDVLVLGRLHVVAQLVGGDHPQPQAPAANHSDGAKIYSGLRTSKTFKLKVGSTGYLALFASDLNRNYSSPARKVVSLAPLIPLRPTSGSSVNASPRLTWKPQTATAYYNVQLFHNGKRILTGWPTQAAFSIPAGKLEHGTYVWFVWPAVKHGSGVPTFGKLIGRATFLYTGK